ncbi:glycosyltransferase family 2 protein [Chryseobacterium zhengzhouense]|uniref:Glycosyltransferase family 2 protein n=1 Tax=Chryseobacterium zhengzhouense TaxID=1636086 RepID=A0ABW2M5A3_9FLAO
MKIALLISTYNWKEALDLVLQSVQIQSVLPDEILIADDGSSEDTKTLIGEWITKFTIPVKHFWHEDDGFRKTIILNKAIKGTEADYIIQIDGDIILSPHFIKDHMEELKKGFFLNGSRALINEANTKKLFEAAILDLNQTKKNTKNRINATRFPLLSKIFRKDHLKSSNVKGCNFSFWKNDFVAVNGYNNEMNGWGHEDIELAARLNNIGVKQRRLKMKAVCYHLHHKYCDRKNENKNFDIYQSVVEMKITTCENGYKQS